MPSTSPQHQVLQVTLNALFALYPLVWLLTVDWDRWSLATEMACFGSLDCAVKLVLTAVLQSLTAGAYDYDCVALVSNPSLYAATRQVAAFAVDAGGRVVHWSSQMEGLTRLPAVEALYQPVGRLTALTRATRAAVHAGVLRGGARVPQGAIEAPVVGLEVVRDGGGGGGEEDEAGGEASVLGGLVSAFFGDPGQRRRRRRASRGKDWHGHGHERHHREPKAETVLFYMLRVGWPAGRGGAGGGGSASSRGGASVGPGGGGEDGGGPAAATPEVVFIAATHDIKSAHLAVAEVARGLVEGKKKAR